MIRAAKSLSVCLMVGVFAFPAIAQVAGPAELPPETFRGDQYVDSGGCVFIRTGINGNTRWVPRVAQDRSPVCGARPSAATAPVRVAAPVIRRAPGPAAPREFDVARPAPIAPAPEAAPVRAAAAPSSVPARPTVTRRPVAQAAAASVGSLPPGCGVSALSARYIPGCTQALTVSTSASTPAATTAPATVQRHFAIARPRRDNEQVVTRLTPSAGAVRIDSSIPSPNRSVGIGGVATGAARGCGLNCNGGGARIATRVPADVAARPGVVVVPAARTTFDVSTPPRGYRAVWADGRLNPNRGPRTLQGDYQSQAIWTNDAPRQLRGVIYSSR